MNTVTEFRLTSHRQFTRWITTIGSFDGLHLGHQYLLNQMKKSAEETGSGIRIITFDPHPKEVLSANTPFPKIYDAEQKIELCKTLGVDSLSMIAFTKEFAEIDSERFLNDYVLKNNDITKLYIGSNFLFGKNREGSFKTIKTIFSKYSIPVEALNIFKLNADVVSSSMIRKTLQAGEFQKAADYLGRHWEISGTVQTGNRIGNKLGFPTINLIPAITLPVKRGVYATLTNICGEAYPSVTNIGMKPTLSPTDRVTVETHILNFNQDLYDRKVSVQPLAFIRPEKKFNGVAELTAQIQKDIESARNIFHQ